MWRFASYPNCAQQTVMCPGPWDRPRGTRKAPGTDARAWAPPWACAIAAGSCYMIMLRAPLGGSRTQCGPRCLLRLDALHQEHDSSGPVHCYEQALDSSFELNSESSGEVTPGSGGPNRNHWMNLISLFLLQKLYACKPAAGPSRCVPDRADTARPSKAKTLS